MPAARGSAPSIALRGAHAVDVARARIHAAASLHLLLHDLPYLSRGLTLDRMRELAARLGNPHERYPIVHVAGTKGKGSTSVMIAAILTAAGPLRLPQRLGLMAKNG